MKCYVLDTNVLIQTPASMDVFEENQIVTIHADQSAKKTHLARVEGDNLKKLDYRKMKPYGISPRNTGQYFLQEALMQPAEKAPLVIVKGANGLSYASEHMKGKSALLADYHEYGRM